MTVHSFYGDIAGFEYADEYPPYAEHFGIDGTDGYIQSEVQRSGDYALRCAPSGEASPGEGVHFSGGSAYWIVDWFQLSNSVRVYFMFGELPESGRAEVFFTAWDMSPSPSPDQTDLTTKVFYDASDGRIHLHQSTDQNYGGTVEYPVTGGNHPWPLDYDSGDVTDGPSIQAGRWYRLEVRCSDWATHRQTDWRVDGVEYPSIMHAKDDVGVQQLPYSVFVGSQSPTPCVMFFDDLLTSLLYDEDSWWPDPPPDAQFDPLYPLGPGYVLAYKVDGCGEHNDPADVIRNHDGSPLDADSWQLIDEVPANAFASFDGVKQVSVDTDAYAEFTFEDSGQNDPMQYVQLWTSDTGIDTGVPFEGFGQVGLKLFFDGTDIYDGTHLRLESAVGFAQNASRKIGLQIYSTEAYGYWPAADLTREKFNDIRLRFGYSNDVNPNPALNSALLEVAYSTEGGSFGGGLTPGMDKATLAHVIVAPDGSACYPIVGDFEAEELVSLGQIGGGGRISRSFYEEHRDIIGEGSELWTYIRETGEPRFWLRLFEPSVSSAPIELRGEGAAGLIQSISGRWFYAGYGTAYWVAQDIQERAKAPKSGPTLVPGAAGNVNVGMHHWKVTFVTADGETRPGPRADYEVLTSAKQVDLINIPKGKGFVTARKIYRTQAGGSTYGLLTTISDNTTTTYTDNTADGGLGAAPPSGFESPDIEVDTPKGAFKFHVPKGSDIADGQRAAILFPLPGDEPITGIEMDLDKTSDTSEYVLRVQKADDEDSAFVTEETLSLDDDGEQRPFVEVSGGPGVLRLLFEKVSTDTGLSAFTLTVSRIRVFGRAPDEDFTTSDIVADVLGEAGISDDLVDESGLPAMPADFLSSDGGEVAGFAAIMTGRPLVLRKDGLKTVGVFPSEDSRKTWRLLQPESVDELDSLPPYNHIRAIVREEEGEVVNEFEVFDENPSQEDRITLEVALANPGTKKLVKHFVDSLADIAFTTRLVGTIACTQLVDENGGRWHTLYAHAGDYLWHPGREVLLVIDRININDSLPVFGFEDPIAKEIERFNARQSRHLALRSR